MRDLGACVLDSEDVPGGLLFLRRTFNASVQAMNCATQQVKVYSPARFQNLRMIRFLASVACGVVGVVIDEYTPNPVLKFLQSFHVQASKGLLARRVDA